jgi:uncharacterized protein (TIGR03437 family)
MRRLTSFLFPYALLALTSLAGVSGAFGYVRVVTGGDTSVSIIRIDNTGIKFYLNSKVVAGLQSSASGKAVTVIAPDSDPQAAVRAALATWNAVGANVKFLPLQSTSLGIDPTDFQMTIGFAEAATDVSALNGAVAITSSFAVVGPAFVQGGQLINCTDNCTYPAGGIYDSDILLNPAMSFSTTGSTDVDLQSVITHELGHALSANHSGLLGATMYPYTQAASKYVWRNLSSDDLDFINATYPLPTSPAPLGTIGGTVTAAGGAAVPYALLTIIDPSAGTTLGALASATGTYSIQVPPGSYLIYAEPFNAFIQPGNFRLTTDQAAMAQPFEATFYGGNATPFPVAVSANNTSPANISVASGTSALAFTNAVFGGAGKSGDVSSFPAVTGPILLPTGQSLDLTFIGKGLDATLTDANFRIYGKGITLRPGSVRVDTKVQFSNGAVLMRATLDIAARQDVGLASMFILKGSDTLALSGLFVMVPPTPTFVSKGVISAASFLGSPNGDGAVSAGGIYSIYDIPNTPNLGPAAFVQNGPYDAYGNLATTLGGVSVTFDGVPAPMFLSFGGQLNFQVPFEIAGKQTTLVVVNYSGSQSVSTTVPVLAVQPGLFTSDGKTVRAYNLPSYTLNDAQHPAPRGSYVEVYGTGVGKVSYSIATGHGAPTFPAGFTGNYTYSVGGSSAAPALFGGWTPTAVGLAQWDLQIPQSGTGNGALSITVTDSTGAASQPGATIFVQ